jgi:hypothetical protein
MSRSRDRSPRRAVEHGQEKNRSRSPKTETKSRRNDRSNSPRPSPRRAVEHGQEKNRSRSPKTETKSRRNDRSNSPRPDKSSKLRDTSPVSSKRPGRPRLLYRAGAGPRRMTPGSRPISQGIARVPEPIKVDREKSCPVLIRVFAQVGSHHRYLFFFLTDVN